MTDPILGSLIGIYSIIAILVSFWLTQKLCRHVGIDSEHWAIGIVIIVCFYLALVMAFIWPIILLSWKKHRKGVTNVRS